MHRKGKNRKKQITYKEWSVILTVIKFNFPCDGYSISERLILNFFPVYISLTEIPARIVISLLIKLNHKLAVRLFPKCNGLGNMNILFVGFVSCRRYSGKKHNKAWPRERLRDLK